MSNRPSNLSDQEINQFINSFCDFMKHANEEIRSYEQREEAREYAKQCVNNMLEQKASELEVTVDYYVDEFLIDI